MQKSSIFYKYVVKFHWRREMRDYGKILREQRIARGKTLKEIEAATGINNANISRWENGKVIPSIYFCELLADFYGITVDELIGRNSAHGNIK